jgi:hypothetical protein
LPPPRARRGSPPAAAASRRSRHPHAYQLDPDPGTSPLVLNSSASAHDGKAFRSPSAARPVGAATASAVGWIRPVVVPAACSALPLPTQAIVSRAASRATSAAPRACSCCRHDPLLQRCHGAYPWADAAGRARLDAIPRPPSALGPAKGCGTVAQPWAAGARRLMRSSTRPVGRNGC